MSGSASGADPLGQLADEFLERWRRGERPALTEYTERYPELADQIRELFPALMVLEQFGSVGGPAILPATAAPRKGNTFRATWRPSDSCTAS